jgi:hypothetical protein
MGVGFDAPVPASLDPWAIALSAAALVAVFRFKVGMIPTLLACFSAGFAALHRSGLMNRRTVLGAALAFPSLTARVRAQGTTGSIDLSRFAAGPLPPDFLTSWRTGQGAVGDWRVVEDASASQGKAIAQLSADPTDYRFPLAVYQPLQAQDVEASVRFKAVSGKGDQAGGLAVRLTDADSYYVVRANALEGNVNLYRVIKGRRQQMAGASAKVPSGVWHTLTLRAEGDRLSVSFDGKPLLTHSDRTFAGPGKIALWTKADSVTHFDRLEIRPLRHAAGTTRNSGDTHG